MPTAAAIPRAPGAVVAVAATARPGSDVDSWQCQCRHPQQHRVVCVMLLSCFTSSSHASLRRYFVGGPQIGCVVVARGSSPTLSADCHGIYDLDDDHIGHCAFTVHHSRFRFVSDSVSLSLGASDLVALPVLVRGWLVHFFSGRHSVLDSRTRSSTLP